MTQCLVALPVTANCKTPAEVAGKNDLISPGPGPVFPPTPPVPKIPPLIFGTQPFIETSFVSRDKSATLIGFDEFLTPSIPPRRYRRQDITGSLALDKTSASNACETLYPGSGGQSGLFPVFYFFNEIASGSVSCALNSIDYATNTAHYTFISASWVNVSGAHIDPGSTPWFAGIDNAASAVPASFSITLGHTFTLDIHVQAIFGYGVGSWVYEAGREVFTDLWSQWREYDILTGAYTEQLTTSRTRPDGSGTIPERNSGVANGNPPAIYVPLEDLVVQLEPVYTSDATVSNIQKTVTGLGCCPTVSGFGRQSINCVGSVNTILSSEDMEADALARQTPTLGISQTARYELRGAGDFTFIYTEVTVACSCDALEIGASYRIGIPITKSDFDGSNPTEDVINVDFTASSVLQVVEHVVQALRGKKVVVGIPNFIFN